MAKDFSRTFALKKNLKLTTITAPKSCPNISVPDELNDYLRDQIYQLTTENESFRKEIAQRDTNIEENSTLIDHLSSKLQEFEGISNDKHFSTASQISAATIADLSKKLREKSSEIEVYKTRCSKMEKTIAELQEKPEAPQELDAKDVEMDEKQERKLQEKLTHVTNKWIEEKNQSLKLRNELKLANKWLQQEIGEKFETLLALNSNSNSNWRGRAQIIQDLQLKNADLRQKLKEQDRGDSPKHAPRCDFKRLEMLNRENIELKENHEELKQKFENAKSRIKFLETECSRLRTRFENMKDEREEDQDLITSLTVCTIQE